MQTKKNAAGAYFAGVLAIAALFRAPANADSPERAASEFRAAQRFVAAQLRLDIGNGTDPSGQTARQQMARLTVSRIVLHCANFAAGDPHQMARCEIEEINAFNRLAHGQPKPPRIDLIECADIHSFELIEQCVRALSHPVSP